MPSRSGVRHLIGSVSRRGPDYHGVQILTDGTHAFDSCYRRAFDTRASIASLVVLADKDFDRVELGKHDASLVYVVPLTGGIHIFSLRGFPPTKPLLV
jgi:hypothetical protein